MRSLIERLRWEHTLTPNEFYTLLSQCNPDDLDFITSLAREVALENFGNKIFIRGLIEIGNQCKNDCYYCGIRRSNRNIDRYHLDEETILSCCQEGYSLGFRTFVLQGGEISDDEMVIHTVTSIRKKFPDAAITLSLGEKDASTYERFFQAGANRYLLRHETHCLSHYQYLHPASMSLSNRLHCIETLKHIGFQTGTGIMVGSPHQTIDNLVEDILYIEKIQPQMIGIGPFLPHHETPFASMPSGNLEQTLLLLSIFRLMHPQALIPSTTALATLVPDGREKGILAGANVVMPNLSPQGQRKKYALYDNKASMGAEAAEGLMLLKKRLESIGYAIDMSRGDYRAG